MVWATESAPRFPELPEALQQTHETIDRCAEHLRVLIDDLLDLASIDSGKMSLTPSDTDIHTLLSETTQVVGDLARKRGLTFCLEQRGNLPRYLWADPVRLKQILFNLCGNAIKFTKRGSVTVALDASRVDEAHVRLHFAISDTGIGMTKAEVERALEPFYQADNSMQRKHEGVGLGLAISARFIEAMGGSLELESEKGHGTTCRFALQMQLGLAPKSNSAVATVKGLRVIVADDAELNRRLLGTLLAGMGHEAIMAENGVEAVAAAAAGEVDLILMDLHMPEMDGISAARAIRTLPDPAAASLPIIALSADVAHERVAECHAAGLDMVLPKPLRQHHLERALQSLFGDGAESLPWVDPRRLREVASTMSHADYAQTLQDFRKTTASLLAALESADDRDRLHLLKGLAANFGLPRLQNSLQRFREGDLTLEALHRVAAESLERLGQNGLS